MLGTRYTVDLCNNSLVKTLKTVKTIDFQKTRKIWIQKCHLDG